MSQPWESPSPLDAVGPLPDFPVGALPGWLRCQVAETARFTQTPAGLAGSVALSVLSAAAGGRAVVEVRGSWREPVNLFCVVALPPGARKSAVFAELVQPLLDTEASMVARQRAAILEAGTLRQIALEDAQKAIRHAARLDDAEAQEKARAEAISKAQLAEAITVPVMPRLVADDITPEACASLLAEHGGRLAVLSAEGGIFAVLAGRYSAGQPNFEVFLKGHSGDMLRVDRRSREPEFIPAPALTLGLCVQPEVLRAIAALPGFRGRGLLARILYSLPADIVGHRRIGEPPVPEDVGAAYRDSVQVLAQTMAEWTDPAVLTLTPGARDRLLDAERDIEPRLDADTGDLAGIRDWAAKQIGATARIAGLLHLAANLRDGWGRPVSEDTMRAALTLGDYFTAHALAAFGHMGTDPVTEDARALLRWINRERPAAFTRRQAHMRVSRSRFPKVTDLDAPLGLLAEHGYIRRQPEPDRQGAGRPPSPAYQVNPQHLATETTQSTEPCPEPDSADSVASVAHPEEPNASSTRRPSGDDVIPDDDDF